MNSLTTRERREIKSVVQRMGIAGGGGEPGTPGPPGPPGEVPAARTISTTAPLTGGGDLSANRVLAVSDATTGAKGVVELATNGENAAGVVVQGNDARLSDARAPTAHTHVLADLPAALITDVELATELADYVDFTTFDDHSARHENGGADEISVAGLSGVLADPQPPIIGAGATQAVAGNDARLTNARTPTAHAATHQPGGSDAMAVDAAAATGSLRTLGVGATQAAAGNDARLSDARTPLAHAASHKSGGSDAIKLDELAAPTDVATLNASVAAHGLLRKLDNSAGHFLDGQGNWSTPPSGGAGQVGTATLDFGAAPGKGDASVDVATLSGLSAASHLRAWLQADATADHNADEHLIAASIVQLVVRYISATTIRIHGILWPGALAARVRGQFTVHYSAA